VKLIFYLSELVFEWFSGWIECTGSLLFFDAGSGVGKMRWARGIKD